MIEQLPLLQQQQQQQQQHNTPTGEEGNPMDESSAGEFRILTLNGKTFNVIGSTLMLVKVKHILHHLLSLCFVSHYNVVI
jgi:hypothetical protein